MKHKDQNVTDSLFTAWTVVCSWTVYRFLMDFYFEKGRWFCTCWLIYSNCVDCNFHSIKAGEIQDNASDLIWFSLLTQCHLFSHTSRMFFVAAMILPIRPQRICPSPFSHSFLLPSSTSPSTSLSDQTSHLSLSSAGMIIRHLLCSAQVKKKKKHETNMKRKQTKPTHWLLSIMIHENNIHKTEGNKGNNHLFPF